MTIQTKREYIALLWDLYRQARKRSDKSRLLDQICQMLEMHRKSAIRLLGKRSVPKFSRTSAPRASRISDEVRKAIALLWHKMGRMGSLAMHAALPEWLGYEAEFSRTLQIDILKVSARSLEGIVREERAKWRRKHNTGTTRCRKPQTVVPLRPLGVIPPETGHMEVDTVAHCGDSMSGTFGWTVTATDILSSWTDEVTVWGKTAEEVCKALRTMEARCPFKWRAIYFDNGTEFINETVEEHFMNKNGIVIPLFRSRPYRKNDQARVEQKNWTHVRGIWGYVRIDHQPVLGLMNSVAENLWLPLQNGFVPQRKTVAKVRVGSKIKKQFDTARTPYERLLERPDSEISLAEKERLIAWKSNLNPFEFRDKLVKRTYHIFRVLDATKERPRKLCA